MLEHRDIEHLDIPELSLPKNVLGKWSAFFIDRYRVVFLVILAVLVIGVSSYFALPRELNPEITLPFGNVFTMYNGAAPDEIETLITDKIESKLEDLEDVKDLTSYSSFGVSSVWIEFEQGVDVDEKLEEMRDKLSGIEADLPDDAETPLIQSIKTNNQPIMIINISGEQSLNQLTNIAERIQDRMESEKDILEVLVIGGVEREIRAVVDPQKLAIYGISLDEIKGAISASNVNFPGGDIVLDERNYNIRTVGELKSVEQLEDVIIRYQASGPLLLKDIATIEDGLKDKESLSRLSIDIASENATMQTSVSISVKKKEQADIIETSGLVRQILEDERGALYPKDLEIQISGDTAKYVEDSLGSVMNNAFSGLYLVLIVLFLFIGFGEAVIVSMVIPLAIMSALWMMKINDMSFNTITLFSLVLAVGMLVDNGIVIMENIDRLRFKGLNSATAAEVGTNQIAPAVAAATLTTLAAFFPIMLTPGIMGAYIKSIPLTVIFTLLGSFFIAMTVTPALCAIFLKKHRSEVVVDHKSPKTILLKIIAILFIVFLALAAFAKDGQVGMLSIVFAVIFGGMMTAKQFMKQKKFEDGIVIQKYSEILYRIITKRRNRWFVVIALVVAFLVSIALPVTGILKVEMFASDDQDRFYVNVSTPNGTPIEITNGISQQVEEVLLQYEEIEGFVANVGITGADSFADTAADAGDPTSARIIVDLLPDDERERTSMDLAADVRERIKDITGADIEVQELENGPPSEAAIAVDIIGENLDDLEKVALDFEDILKSIPGTRDAGSSISNGDPELQVIVDKERAARHGLNDMTVAIAIRNAVNGLKATTYRVDQDEIDVVVKTSDIRLQTKTDLEKLYFYNAQGQAIEFNQVARLVETIGYSTIEHEETKRRVKVTSGLEDGMNAAEITQIFNEKIEAYDYPDGVTMEQGGEMEDINKTFMDMLINMTVAGILVYLILAVQFNSLTQPFIILCTVPMALIGVMWGLLLTGNYFGFVSFVGVVALVGIAVNDAIVLVDYINYLRKSGYDLYDAVKETGVTRFIPVMATTITTAGGILPITLKNKFFAPMGYALIFGLMMATILTLVAIPVMYTMLEERKIKKAERKRMKKNKLYKPEKDEKGGVVIEKDTHIAYNR